MDTQKPFVLQTTPEFEVGFEYRVGYIAKPRDEPRESDDDQSFPVQLSFEHGDLQDHDLYPRQRRKQPIPTTANPHEATRYRPQPLLPTNRRSIAQHGAPPRLLGPLRYVETLRQYGPWMSPSMAQFPLTRPYVSPSVS